MGQLLKTTSQKKKYFEMENDTQSLQILFFLQNAINFPQEKNEIVVFDYGQEEIRYFQKN